mmetsp:Transcript_78515/g.177318  ORF Transcript_78515/g.177318 Transcript_78515/m.177318 type:complete len:201 (-) Transcript_78515:301-903(-)
MPRSRRSSAHPRTARPAVPSPRGGRSCAKGRTSASSGPASARPGERRSMPKSWPSSSRLRSGFGGRRSKGTTQTGRRRKERSKTRMRMMTITSSSPSWTSQAAGRAHHAPVGSFATWSTRCSLSPGMSSLGWSSTSPTSATRGSWRRSCGPGWRGRSTTAWAALNQTSWSTSCGGSTATHFPTRSSRSSRGTLMTTRSRW